MGFSFDALAPFAFLDNLAREDGEDTIYHRKEEGEDDVQIMTVHMSKGLEFEDGFCPRTCFPNPAWRCEEVEAEKQRLLYVAATRAKKRLYIPIPNSTKEAADGTRTPPMELFCSEIPRARKNLGRRASKNFVAGQSLWFEKS